MKLSAHSIDEQWIMVNWTYKENYLQGADGVLLLLRDLQGVQPDTNKNKLAHMINPKVKLKAYNGTQIEQYGHISLYLSYHSKTKKCRFYVVYRPTVL